MAASKKVKIDLDPSGPITFDRPVRIPTEDGREFKLPLTFKYRDRVAMAEWAQLHLDKARAAADEPVPADPFAIDVKAETLKRIDTDADDIVDVVTDWGVEGMAFNRENVVKFVTRFPGAARAILVDYRIGLTEGRTGN